MAFVQGRQQEIVKRDVKDSVPPISRIDGMIEFGTRRGVETDFVKLFPIDCEVPTYS